MNVFKCNLNGIYRHEVQPRAYRGTLDSLLLKVFQAGIDTLDSAQAIKMYNIANQCPMLGGLAVYTARSAFNRFMNTDIQFSDSCAGGHGDHRATKPKGNGNSVQQMPITNENVKVYPNPANTLLTIEVQLKPGTTDNVCLYSDVGELIRCQTLVQNLTTISTEGLSVGIYYYRITDNNGTLVKADKVAIIH